MMTIQGYVEREVPDPAHENESPNWFKVTKRFPKEFSGETEEEIFRQIQAYNDHAYYSTCNGLVPSFRFSDEAQLRRYRAFDEAHPYFKVDYSHTF